jgi:hypothetical protein
VACQLPNASNQAARQPAAANPSSNRGQPDHVPSSASSRSTGLAEQASPNARPTANRSAPAATTGWNRQVYGVTNPDSSSPAASSGSSPTGRSPSRASRNRPSAPAGNPAVTTQRHQAALDWNG